MILFSFALYHEAKPFIEQLGLKKTNAFSSFQFFSGVFENAHIYLVITGTGRVKSALGTGFLCNEHPTAEYIINAGWAGGSTEHSMNIGDIFCAESIRDIHTERVFYPDVIEQKNVLYFPLTCVSKPSTKQEYKCSMVDMESSGFFEAASCFFAPHQIQCYKMISDLQDSQWIDINTLKPLWNNSSLKIINSVFSLPKLLTDPIFTKYEEREIEQYFENNRHTVSEKIQKRKILANQKVTNGIFTIPK